MDDDTGEAGDAVGRTEVELEVEDGGSPPVDEQAARGSQADKTQITAARRRITHIKTSTIPRKFITATTIWIVAFERPLPPTPDD